MRCWTILSRGKSREFLTEAKVVELIAYQVDALLKPVVGQRMFSPSLTRVEEQKIDECYQAFQQNVSNPPSLPELARSSGLSIYRLKNGFRQRYGDSPFRLITELRMLRAKELLEQGELNVSEVAMEVGYTSLGTFSNTFHARFGLRPSSYKN
jgi:transcriptional regulator GlxA family with amidase domain